MGSCLQAILLPAVIKRSGGDAVNVGMNGWRLLPAEDVAEDARCVQDEYLVIDI